MFWLIEDTQKIDLFTRMRFAEAYVEVIPVSHKQHHSKNTISLVFIHPLNHPKGYILPIKHNDAICVEEHHLHTILNSIEIIHTLDKKTLLHYINHPSIIQPFPFHFTPHKTTTHEHFQRLYPTNKQLNTIVPLVKHYESCMVNFKSFVVKHPNPFYNNIVIPAYHKLEQCGIKVDTALFKQCFGRGTEEYVYTNYNFLTTTTRPSNVFNGINYSTLNKENGERKCFIPRNSIFIEFDVSAYHPRLLANLLGYEFGDIDIHQHFAELYNVDYAKAKEITFQQLYGGIWKQYENLVYFRKVKQYLDQLWEQFNTQGYVECPTSKLRFYRENIEDATPNKILNYILQAEETSTNALILNDIYELLDGKNTQVILVVFDSFLLDVDKTEKDTIQQVMAIFSKYNLDVKFKHGNNYQLN